MNILIIGGTSGIGKALYDIYSKDNRVAIIGRRTNILKMLYENNPHNTIIATADITVQSEITEAIESICIEFDKIDLAIVCSGIGEINPSLEYSIERPTLDTNVIGWTFCIDKLWHIFHNQGHGHLVAITSVGGLRGEPMSPAYSASKAYQINYMEALRKKSYKMNSKILVTDIRPGLVDTAMAKGEGLFWVMPVEKVSQQIYRAIINKSSKAYVTRRWHILAMINKILPFCLYKKI